MIRANKWGLGYGHVINEALSPLQNISTYRSISEFQSIQNHITLQCGLF